MAEGDPPGPSIHSPTAARAPIRFPDVDHSLPKPFHAHPARRSSPLATNGSVGMSNGRRRVHSVNPGPSLPSHPRSRRPVSSSFGPSQTASHRETMSSVLEDSGIGLFSDEYDLCECLLFSLGSGSYTALQPTKASPTANPSWWDY